MNYYFTFVLRSEHSLFFLIGAPGINDSLGKLALLKQLMEKNNGPICSTPNNTGIIIKNKEIITTETCILERWRLRDKNTCEVSSSLCNIWNFSLDFYNYVASWNNSLSSLDSFSPIKTQIKENSTDQKLENHKFSALAATHPPSPQRLFLRYISAITTRGTKTSNHNNVVYRS